MFQFVNDEYILMMKKTLVAICYGKSEGQVINRAVNFNFTDCKRETENFS